MLDSIDHRTPLFIGVVRRRTEEDETPHVLREYWNICIVYRSVWVRLIVWRNVLKNFNGEIVRLMDVLLS